MYIYIHKLECQTKNEGFFAKLKLLFSYVIVSIVYTMNAICSDWYIIFSDNIPYFIKSLKLWYNFNVKV